MEQSFFITTPIYYVNAQPHLGHAYSTIVADALTRFHKICGEHTFFLTGTDEHGDKIVQAAAKNNQTPKEFVDHVSHTFRDLWPKLDIENDFFIRTTDPDHIKKVQQFLQKVYDAGDIYFGEFSGHYCYGCERFYTEKELEDGLCPQHKTKPALLSEKNYFFRMSKYLPWLKEYIEQNPDFIRPERYRAEVLSMLESSVLDDLCISRPKSRLTWGIELPFDSDYVCYVWFDALLNYITAIGWPERESFGQFWPAEHLVAKDILKPHAIFWPTMLKSAGLPVYRHLNVHGYWLSRDTKMSKSLGNVIAPLDMVSRYGVDAFRYFLLREMHFGSDANFSEDALVARINADLANDLGNLFSRVLSMLSKYTGSVVPQCDKLEECDKQLILTSSNQMQNFMQLFGRMQFAHALESLWEFIRFMNKYVDAQAPWALYKANNLNRLATVMSCLLTGMRKVAICLWPVMPEASRKMLDQLGQFPANEKMPTISLAEECTSFSPMGQGSQLAESSNIFPRIEIKAENHQKTPAKEQKSKQQSPELPQTIDISIFQNFDIRVGTILSAEKHPNADRILCLNIDFGEDIGDRQILSGLAESYAPEALVGKQVCAILNLPVRKIRGLESCGMVLTAQTNEKTRLLGVDECMPNGSAVC